MKVRPGWRVLRVEGTKYHIQFVAHGRKHWARRAEWPYEIMRTRRTYPRRKRHAMRARRMRITLFHARMQAIVEAA
jgi:hypothetical protein